MHAGLMLGAAQETKERMEGGDSVLTDSTSPPSLGINFILSEKEDFHSLWSAEWEGEVWKSGEGVRRLKGPCPGAQDYPETWSVARQCWRFITICPGPGSESGTQGASLRGNGVNK